LLVFLGNGQLVELYAVEFDPLLSDCLEPLHHVGYATAPDPGGPWTEYGSNPFITFGATYDAGTVADPYCLYVGGAWYIYYACSTTTSTPWQTAVGWTSDWTTFHKVGLWLPHEASGWDAQDSFRGAITVVGREYVAPTRARIQRTRLFTMLE